MKNLELKSKCSDLNAVVRVCWEIGAQYGGILIQTDTYYNVPEGRMKLRNVNNEKFELIYYFRVDSGTEKESNYEIIKLDGEREIKKILKESLGVKGVVKKKRELYLYQNVRIHLDTVAKLGKFIELEAVCNSSKDLKEAPGKIKYLKEVFDIKKKDLVAKSYIDLIK